MKRKNKKRPPSKVLSKTMTMEIKVEAFTNVIRRMYLRFRKTTVVRAEPLADGHAFADYDRAGRLVGIEFLKLPDVEKDGTLFLSTMWSWGALENILLPFANVKPPPVKRGPRRPKVSQVPLNVMGTKMITRQVDPRPEFCHG